MHRDPYQSSTEELTQTGGDPLAAVPLAIPDRRARLAGVVAPPRRRCRRQLRASSAEGWSEICAAGEADAAPGC